MLGTNKREKGKELKVKKKLSHKVRNRILVVININSDNVSTILSLGRHEVMVWWEVRRWPSIMVTPSVIGTISWGWGWRTSIAIAIDRPGEAVASLWSS